MSDVKTEFESVDDVERAYINGYFDIEYAENIEPLLPRNYIFDPYKSIGWNQHEVDCNNRRRFIKLAKMAANHTELVNNVLNSCVGVIMSYIGISEDCSRYIVNWAFSESHNCYSFLDKTVEHSNMIDFFNCLKNYSYHVSEILKL